MSTVLTWASAIILLGIVIFVHELGHFYSARKAGIKVKSFGMGFGPKLFSWTGKDGVQYVLRLLPLGGYCRYYGEDETIENDEDAFYNQPVGKRALSTFAGPLMNFVTAVVAFFLFLAVFGELITVPVIGEVNAGQPAAESGLLVGDRFVRVNGAEVKNTADVSNVISKSDGEPVELTIDRHGSLIGVVVVPEIIDPEAGRAMIGITYAFETQRHGVWDSAVSAVKMTGLSAMSIFDFLKGLVTRGQGAGDVVGPIGTIQVVAQETRVGGFRAYIAMLGIISVSLGFFNLLPIPGLDGSRLLFLLVEKIRGKRIDPNKEGMVHLIGIGLLLLLMIPVYIRDIVKLF